MCSWDLNSPWDWDASAEMCLPAASIGVMSAEGALDDPSIFARAIAHVHAERERLAAHVQDARALKKAKRDEGRLLTNEERAMVKGR